MVSSSPLTKRTTRGKRRKMREIPLTQQDEVVIVDDADYEWLSKYRWYRTGNGYAMRHKKRDSDGKNSFVLMHREILGTPDGLLTDHINHNRLDNRRANLRIADYAQNAWNKPHRSTGTSKYRGVTWSGFFRKWVAHITVRKKRTCIGCFKDEMEAAKAYNAAALKYHGEFATLNRFEEAPNGNHQGKKTPCRARAVLIGDMSLLPIKPDVTKR